MGRFVSTTRALGEVGDGVNHRLRGRLPVFGTGRVELLYAHSPNVFVAQISGIHRIRVLGGGASCLLAGQTTSFAALLSATGGQPPVALVGGIGGTGIGGAFQASGGPGGDGIAATVAAQFVGGGGGGAGSQLGNGGRGGHAGRVDVSTFKGAGGGGGAVGGVQGGDGSAKGGGYGGSPYSVPTADHAGVNVHGTWGSVEHRGLQLPFVDFLGGAVMAVEASPGAGSGGYGGARSLVLTSGAGSISGTGGPGGWGGGGGGVAPSAEANIKCGIGGYGGGGGGGRPSAFGGGGGGGFAMGEFHLEAGQSYPVTIASRLISEVGAVETAPGLIIVEW